jgi:PAS domain S-box-containing protein
MRKFSIVFYILLSLLTSHHALSVEKQRITPTKRAVDSLNNLADNLKYTETEAYGATSLKALAFARQINYLHGEAIALQHMASYYSLKENYTKTYECLIKVTDIFESVNDTNCLIEFGYLHLTELMVNLKAFDDALKYIDIASRLSSFLNNHRLQGKVMSTYGYYSLMSKDYNTAILSLYLSIFHSSKVNDLSVQARAFKLLGDIYNLSGNSVIALYFYEKSVTSYSQTVTGEMAEKAIVKTRIAKVYQDLGRYYESLHYNKQALDLRKQVGNQLFIASSYFNVGEGYYQLGKIDSATLYFQKALSIVKKHKNNYMSAAINRQLYVFAKEEGNYFQALEYLKSAVESKKRLLYEKKQTEIILQDANRSISSEQAKNELLQKQIEIQQLQFTNRLIKIVVFEIIFISMVFISIGILVFISRQRRKKQKLININYRLLNEIRERKEVADRLHQSEELYRFLADNTIDVISMLDKNLRRIYVSPLCVKLFGYSAGEMCGFETPLQLVHPNDRHLVNQYLLGILNQKKAIRYSYKAIRKDGSFFWAEKSLNPVIDDRTGEISEIITVIRDISDLKVHEEEIAQNARKKEQLLHEIHNRVKNNFSILVSLMSMQRETSDDRVLNNSLADMQLRIRAMSLVHEHLFNTQQISEVSFDDYLLRLAFVISGSYNNDRIRLKTSIHHCVVPIEMALPLGLIVNELMTNVYKYAFPGDRSGLVKIRLAPAGSQQFCLTVSDDGIGLPDGFTLNDAVTMGSQIISLLVEQIEAKLEIKSDAETSFNITFST